MLGLPPSLCLAAVVVKINSEDPILKDLKCLFAEKGLGCTVPFHPKVILIQFRTHEQKGKKIKGNLSDVSWRRSAVASLAFVRLCTQCRVE